MPVDEDTLKKFDFKSEEWEAGRDIPGNIVRIKTGFPKSVKNYRIVLEDHSKSVEEVYYWLLDHIRYSQGYHDIRKITDVFSASEQSSFFGNSQQRLGMQQDKVSMFLATIGKMVKELFQLVREIRVLDERLGYYNDSFDADSRSRGSAEITLKGIWIDMVEQGAKNPASVYGMARELQFTTLPDLFFSIHPSSIKAIDQEVDNLDFNNKLKEVLKRKLRQFMEWKKHTHSELANRRTFTLKYLRQHFDIIRMYMQWVKPYLRNIKRMQHADHSKSPDLLSAFEGTMIELEFLAIKKPQWHKHSTPQAENKYFYSVQVMHFMYRTKPSMNYFQEYQKGPLHVGQTQVTMLGYAWTQKQIDNYIKMMEQEDLKLLESVDGSVKAAMESLGDELEGYLREAGENISFKDELAKGKDKPNMLKPGTAIEPFTNIFKGFWELGTAFGGPKTAAGGKKEKMPNSSYMQKEEDAAKSAVEGTMWQTYKNFKKNVNMLAW